MGLEGVGIDQTLDHSLCLLVNFVSVEGAVDEGRCFASVEGKQLLGIALDFLLGYLEYLFNYLRFMVLYSTFRQRLWATS